jgi:hypothetical protein
MATTEVNFSQAIDNITFNGSDVDELVIDGKLVWNGITYSYPSQLLVQNYTSEGSGNDSGNLSGIYDRHHASWRIRNGQWIGGFNGRPFWTRNMAADWHSLIYWCPGDSNWKLVGPLMGGLDGVDDHLESIGSIDSSEGTDWLKCGSQYMGSTVDRYGDHGPISPELGTWFSQWNSPHFTMPLVSNTPFFVHAV